MARKVQRKMATGRKPSRIRARLKRGIEKWLKERDGLNFSIGHDTENTRKIQITFTTDSHPIHNLIDEIRYFLEDVKCRFGLVINGWDILKNDVGVQFNCTLV